jgi:hypothetical protein
LTAPIVPLAFLHDSEESSNLQYSALPVSIPGRPLKAVALGF